MTYEERKETEKRPPTPAPILSPIETETPRPTEAAPTKKPTLAPRPTEVVPTATAHVCTVGDSSHWYGVYDYYDENRHTRHHVTTTYCTECGKEIEKANELKEVHLWKDM